MASVSVIQCQNDVSESSKTYSYSSRPRAVPIRKRYRGPPDTSDQDDGPVRYGNLMYDRRVVRGNTYALQELPWDSEADPTEIQKQREAHRKMLARKHAKEELQAKVPEIAETGSRVNVQTELFLEEIADRIIEVDIECQTDDFLDRPETPLYIPTRTGKDASTQIEEGELFDFDIEVKPILQVLVGKTIEQALLEVTEEEDLVNLRAHQYAYHELLNAEKAEVQRLEEQERRHREEKARRMAEQTQVLEQQRAVKEKVAARAFALHCLTDLIPSIFSGLRDRGYFYDTVERDIEKGFLPYLLRKTERSMEKIILGRIMTDSLIDDVVKARLKEYAVSQNPALRRRLPKASENSLYPSMILM